MDFTGPVDSVYLDAPGYVELDVGTGESLICDFRSAADAALTGVAAVTPMWAFGGAHVPDCCPSTCSNMRCC